MLHDDDEEEEEEEEPVKRRVAHRNILASLLEKNLDCVVSKQTIHNAQAKMKKKMMEGHNTVEEVLHQCNQRGYRCYWRNEENNILSNVEFSTRPPSEFMELRRAAQNILHHVIPLNSEGPVSRAPPMVINKGRRKTDSTRRDKSHWEHIQIVHARMKKSSEFGSGSGSGSGPGTSSIE
ncbi:hypothetical protein M9H77_12194 [Catharanthus roseus]|uniref:Uncharacterized protein n=1 Tax=Catharanthus roseus TaxID=4058 RepID=A0ACC0BGR7_CATRO|nr:hypothetical protein M9H77_12194 [Catharanthus roseus]